VAIVATVVDALVQGFLDLFGGSSGPPPTPRKLLHQRHPLYPDILGVSYSLIPDEVSAGKCQFCGDPSPCPNERPLQRVEDPTTPSPEQNQKKKQSFKDCMVGAAASYLVIAPMACVGAGIGCIDLGAPGVNVAACKVALPFCVATAATIAACASGTALPEF
jgi:hypothetical protein